MKIRNLQLLASLLFGMAVYLFWIMVYPAHFNYQEQYQCFLYTFDYLADTVNCPGGFMAYISRFLTQFFYNIHVGALLYAVLLIVLQRLTWRVMMVLDKQEMPKHYWYALSFIPAAAYWMLTCDENYFLAGILDISMALLVVWGCVRITVLKWRMLAVLASMPILFVMVGGGFWFPALLILLFKSDGWKNKICLLLAGSVLAVLVVLAASHWVQYPMWRLWAGINQFRIQEGDILVQIIGLSSVFVAIVAYLFVPTVPKIAKQKITVVFSAVVIAWGTYYLVSNSCNMEYEEYMAYDECVRRQDWRKIIEMGNEKVPHKPYTVAYLNLALGKTGQLGNRMFHYFQHGSEGLIRDFVRHPVGALVSSEIYYHLGLVNIAQCHAFEAMEAVPDYQKSVRIMQRLTETNLINRQYEVARKYARILQKTHFYKDWADEVLACIDDSVRFSRHKEWVYMREVRNVEDFHYSSKEKDMMLGLLYTHNYRNKMAFEYLMAYCLLNKDLPHFVQYFSVGRNLNYQEIPRHFQEGLAMFWLQQHNSLQGMPWPINPIVKRNISDYASIYMRHNSAKNMLQTRYKSTFWYYCNYGD